MRNTIMNLVTLMAFTFSIYAQNAIDPPVLPNNLCNLESSAINRNFQNYLIGWNYGSPNAVMDDILKINYSNHVTYEKRANWYFGLSGEYLPNQNRTITVQGTVNPIDNIICLKGYTMYYEPAITVDNTDTFLASGYNYEGGLWGWQEKDQNIEYYPVTDNTNKGNVQLRKINYTSKTKILWDVYPNNSLFYQDYNDFTGAHNSDTALKYNCNSFYLSVNLRSKEILNFQNFEKVALTLRIPFKYKDEQGNIHNDYIKFSQLPKADILNLPNDTIHITGSRGDFRGFGRKEEVVLPTDKFEIKGKMLALTSSIGNDQSITLSAYFKIDKDNLLSANKIEFRNSPTTSTGIYEYDVEVEYNDEIDIDLNWVKLETPHARDLFRGVWDNRIATLVNNQITHHESIDNVNNVVIHRFYGDDEITMNLWYCNRYYNMLLDSLVGLETGVNTGNKPTQFLHATAFKEYWNGGNIGFGTHQSAPYINRGDPDCYLWRNTFGIVRGYGGMGVNEIYSSEDIKKSHYETKIDIADITQFQNDYNYNNISGFQTKVQPSIDMQLIYNYVYNKSLIFSHKPWNAWIWPGSEKWYAVDHLGLTNDTIAVSGSRPKTGEELNYMVKLPVFLGAKGVYYWLKTKMYDLNKIHNIANEDRGTYSSLQPDDASNFINNLPQNISQFDEPSMTLDFLDFNNNDGYYNWSQYFNPGSYRWDLMGINQNRIYIGLQTARYELKKLNEWLEINGDDLINMNLIAWYGKGHTKIKLGNFVENYDDNIINKFIDISQIKTRPLGYERNGVPFYEQNMSPDSSFYDVMIHQNGTTSLDDEWTLAVVNRRTDPLVYVIDTLPYQSEDQYEMGEFYNQDFKFYSTHEYDSFCDNGGNVINPFPNSEYIINTFKDADYWRSLYWKRQGIREIRLKFKYQKPGTHDKVLLRVEELLAENEPTTDQTGAPGTTPEWWRQERWNNAVKDTVIRSDGELVLKMLPGEGKMFKVTIEKTQDIVGELANSNQTKIIAYPAHQTSYQDYSGHDDSVYYHMV